LFLYGRIQQFAEGLPEKAAGEMEMSGSSQMRISSSCPEFKLTSTAPGTYSKILIASNFQESSIPGSGVDGATDTKHDHGIKIAGTAGDGLTITYIKDAGNPNWEKTSRV
jgi:hypothetical protein